METSVGETLFDTRRRAVLALLGLSSEDPTVASGYGRDRELVELFARLATLDDAQILSILGVVMGETLAVGSSTVELLGVWLKPDMAALWTADDAFFDGLRDRKVVSAMLREVAGKKVADANLTEKIKTQKAIIRDCLAGEKDRKKVGNWVPKWLAFPPAAYVGRPFPIVDRFNAIAGLAKGLPAPVTVPAAWIGGDDPASPDVAPTAPDFAIAAE